MSTTFPTAPGAANLFLSVLRALNLLAGVMILLLLVFSIYAEPALLRDFSSRPSTVSPALLLNGLRVLAFLGLLMIPLAHVALTQLIAIVDTVRHGDPFVPENAGRLKRIAWVLLGVESLNLCFGLLANLVSSANAQVEWNFSPSGWVAVVLLFTLAHVFEQGTRMRQDLEGTV